MFLTVNATTQESYYTSDRTVKYGIKDDFRYTLINKDQIVSIYPANKEYNYSNPFKGNPENFIEFPLDKYDDLTVIVTTKGTYVVDIDILELEI